MGGPNLEVFKFGFYMFFPIFVMFKFGDPDWYDNYVLPYKNALLPAYESTNRPPKTGEELKEELARIKAQRAAKRGKRLDGAGSQEDVRAGQEGRDGGIDGAGRIQAELGRIPRPHWNSSSGDRLV